MSELLLLGGAAILGGFAIYAWRKHVKSKQTWVQQGFEEFMKSERARRTEKG